MYNKRVYSTVSENHKYWLGEKKGEMNLNNKLNPYFVTGFIDGEGSFMIRIRKDSRSRVGWAVAPVFQLGLHTKDYIILEQLKSYFGVGKIYKHSSNSMQLRIESFKDLTCIIEHFDRYPLITQKKADYEN